MTQSLQLHCVRVTVLWPIDLFLDWISREWDSQKSRMTNYKKLTWSQTGAAFVFFSEEVVEKYIGL